MHATAQSSVLGYIDSNTKGWCFHITDGIKQLRFKNENKEQLLEPVPRSDVAKFYSNDKIINCGWNLETEENGKIEMYIDGFWVTIFFITINKQKITHEINKEIPSYIVVDNFYTNPDKVREFALTQQFQENIKYYKGKRTAAFRFQGLKERFEQILNHTIINWEVYGTNCCFQYCVKDDKTVYHIDQQQYAGVLFLTPDAPVTAGTQILRSNATKKTTVTNEESAVVFKNGYYDSSAFELVDTIGNVYNRLVIFNSRMIHAAPTYFGDSLQNSRLFQLFFFDLADTPT